MRYIPVAQLGIKKKKRKVPLRSRVGPLADADFDVYEETGLFYDQYLQILQTHRDEIAAPRTVGRQNTVGSLCGAARLFMVLNYLRDGGLFRRVAKRYGVSKSYVSREIRHVIPILYSSLSFISWPLLWSVSAFAEVSAAIDCTCHFRVRVHPRQAD